MFKKSTGIWVDLRLGDMVEKALSTVGITEERVGKWLGAPCGCKERQEKLNRLGAWVKSLFSGSAKKEHLEEMLSEEESRERIIRKARHDD